MALQQGTVVIASDQFTNNRSKKRPYIIINNRNHPFHGKQYLCMSVSTTEYDEGVLLEDDFFIENDLYETSYASPWTTVQVPAEDVEKIVGQLKSSAVEALLTEMFSYVNPDTRTKVGKVGDSRTDDETSEETESQTGLVAD